MPQVELLKRLLLPLLLRYRRLLQRRLRPLRLQAFLLAPLLVAQLPPNSPPINLSGQLALLLKRQLLFPLVV